MADKEIKSAGKMDTNLSFAGVSETKGAKKISNSMPKIEPKGGKNMMKANKGKMR